MNRRPRMIRFLVLGILAFQGWSESVVAVEPPLEMEEVVESVYSVRRKFVGSNAAVIINDRDVMVVDTHASPAAARGTLAAVREITDKPVRYVVNTHWHTDHFVGNQAYFDAFPGQVEFISHETAREDIVELAPEQLPIAVRYAREDLEMATRFLLMGKDENNQPLSEDQIGRLRRFVDDQGKTINGLETQPLILPDLTVQQGLTLHRAEREIQILFLGRGHTRGDLVVYLPQDKTIIAGDLVTHPTLHVGGTSRPVEWLESLRALAQLDFEVLVPGHGEVVRDRMYVDLIIAILESVVEQVRFGIDQGLKYAEIEPQVHLEDVHSQWVGDDRDRAAMFEAARDSVVDTVGRTYLELTGRLD